MKTTTIERIFKLACMTTAVWICLLMFIGTSRAQDEFTVSSPKIEEGGSLPVKYSCNGEGVSIPINWSGAPDDTRYFAVNLWHTPLTGGEDDKRPGGTDGKNDKRPRGPGGKDDKGQGSSPPQKGKNGERPGGEPGVKSYWLVYNIPADINGLPEDAKGIGTDGYSDKMETGFDPMCSKGPGLKTYHITVWALSEEPTFTTDKIQRTHLLEAIKDITFAEDTFDFTFDRKRP